MTGRFVAALGRVLRAGVLAIAAIELLLIVLRPEDGPFALIQVLAPHLALVGLVAIVPLLLIERGRAAIPAIALIAIVGARFGGDWVSLPGSTPAGVATARTIEVVTWNLEIGSRPAARTVELLRSQHADVIALQELETPVAGAIEADPVLRAAYPFRRLVPRDDVLGLGILSRFPIRDASFALGPAVQSAAVDVDGAELAVVNVHPTRGDFATLGSTGVPIGIDVRARNRDLESIRDVVDAAAMRRDVVAVGDLNTASSEPAFERFVSGLRDVHAEVGEGLGWTWRPQRLEPLGIGLIRIDHVVVTSGLRPVAIRESCPTLGDHCAISAWIAISPRADAAATG